MDRRYDKHRQALQTGELQRKSGLYVFRYIDNNSHKRHYLYANSLVKLRTLEKQLQRDIDDGIIVNSEQSNLTLNDLFKLYMQVKKVEPTTRESYERDWNLYVRDTLGVLKVSNIKASDVKLFYSRLDKAGYAHGTLGNIQNVLFPTLELAVDDDLIRKNPAKRALGNYGKPSKKKIPLTAVQEDRLLAFAQSSNVYSAYYPMLIVMFGTGLRCGELIGLTWKNINLQAKELTIDHQLVYKDLGEGYKAYIRKPKTKAGNRVLPLISSVYEALKMQLKFCTLMGVRNKFSLDGYSDFVFVTGKGTPLLPSALNYILTELVAAYNKKEQVKAAKEHREAELMPHLSSHYFRHTFGTRMNERNVNIKVIQTVLGHENISTTLNIYTHVNADNLKNELTKMEDESPDNPPEQSPEQANDTKVKSFCAREANACFVAEMVH